MRRRIGLSPARAGTLGVALVALALTGCGAFLTAHYRIERAQREMKAGEWQRAAFDLRAVLQKNAQNAQAWLLLARVSLDAADPSGAASALVHARAAGAQGPPVADLQAKVWLATGKPQALLDAIEHHTIQLPQPAETVLRARALLAAGQTDQAVATIEPLVAQQPSVTDAQVVLAECLIQGGKFGQALKVLATAERLDPKSPEPSLLAGRIEQLLGQFAAAERALTRSLERMPRSEPITDRVVALIALADSRLALGNIDAAAESQKALAQLEPQAPETLLLDAQLKLARKDLVGGTVELERVVAEAPNFVQARMVLGAALLQRGDLEQARQQFQQVVAATPDNLQARKLLADVQLKLGRPGAALGVLTPTLAAPSLDPQLLSLLGEAARRSGHPEALTETLERDLHEHPNDPAVADNLAAAYLSTGQAEQAVSLLETSGADSDVRRDTLLIAALLASRGPDAAGKKVNALVASRPRDLQLLDLAASYWASQHQLEQSRSLLRQALSIDPSDPTAQIALARVEEAQGNSAAAQRRLSAAIAAHPEVVAFRLALADVLMGMHSLDQARAVLEAAPGAAASIAVQFALARVALTQGDLAQANNALDRAVAAQPGRIAILDDAGVLLMQANQYAAALDRFARATAAEPNNALYWLQCARAQLALNQPAAARASLEKAARLQPKWLPVVSMLALIDLRQGMGQAALARVDALLVSEPHSPGALVLKGDVEVALHQVTAAMAAYDEAQRLQPSAPVAVKLYQVRLAAHAADPIKPLQRWLKRVPADWQVRSVLADYYLSVAHAVPQAVRELRAVLRQQPNDAIALNNLAWVLGSSGDPAAESLAERAYHLAPNVAGVNDTLGWLLAKQGKSVEALPYLARAVKLAPQDSDLAYHYAYALARTGRSADARVILSKILASPQPFQARDKAQQLLASLKA